MHRRRRAGDRHIWWPSRLVQHASPHDRATLYRRDRGYGWTGSDHLRPHPYRPHQIAPAAVGAYIGAAYFFTSSTSFANPAITIGRMFSDTFAGIARSSAPGYIAAQLIGGAVGFVLVRLFCPT